MPHHDNDTTLGWYSTVDEKTKDHVRRYLRVDGREVGWDLVPRLTASVSKARDRHDADILAWGQKPGSTPRASQPATAVRYRSEQLSRAFDRTAPYLKKLSALYGREPRIADL